MTGNSEKSKFLHKIAEYFTNNPLFKGFHGKVSFNLRDGRCKNINTEQNIIHEKQNISKNT